MDKDRVYAQHILDAIFSIEKFIGGGDYEKFSNDQLLQDGVVRELEIIGEATKKLSEEFKKSMPSLPWKDIAGMRDKLIHDYFSVDLEEVWKAATEDIELLKKELLKKTE